MMMGHKGCVSIAFALLCLHAAVLASQTVWIPGFTGLFWTSSIVTPNGRWLYIDGGEMWNGTDLWHDGFALVSTQAIDLSRSWTNTTLPFIHAFDKPADFPYARQPTIWYSEPDKTIYSYGGSIYNWTVAPGGGHGWSYNDPSRIHTYIEKPPGPRKLWQLKTDDDGLAIGGWIPSPLSVQPSSSVAPVALGGLATVGDGDLWNLGGTIDSETGGAVPGIAKFDGTSRTWSNITISPLRYLSLGQAVFSPLFGTRGVNIYLGGFSSSKPYRISNGWAGNHQKHLLSPMSSVLVYDIESGNLFNQSVFGQPPPSRYGFCAVGVEDGQGHLDIFAYGGSGVSETYGDIFVLSIPEFRWTLLDSKKTRSGERVDHTCKLAGKRQMISIGGTPGGLPSGPDEFANGIGVFDMSALAWSPRYDAHAKPYVRSKVLVKALAGTTYPQQWNDTALQKIFEHPQSSSNNPVTSSPSSSSPSSSSSSPNAAVIGGSVAGAVVALVLIVALTWYYLRRRRRRQQQQEQQQHQHQYPKHQVDEYQEYSQQDHEFYNEKFDLVKRHDLIFNSNPAELDGSQPSELPTSPRNDAWEIGSGNTLVTPKDSRTEHSLPSSGSTRVP